MKRFQCSCGGPIFFDNHQCLQCGARVGFDPESMSMVPVEERADQTYCENYDHSVCNWLRPIAPEHTSRTSSIFLPTTFKPLIRAAPTMIAVPC